MENQFIVDWQMDPTAQSSKEWSEEN